MLRSLFSIASAGRAPLAAALSLTVALAACSDDPTQPTAVAPNGPSRTTFSDAVIAVTEASYDFGKVALGDSTATHGYTIMNVGLAPLSISSISIGNFVGGTFQYVWDFPNRCNYTVSIPPGGTCAVPFYFKPTYSGASSMDITVYSNGGNVTFKALGSAYQPVVVSPNEVSFAEQGVGSESAPQSIRFTNTGPSAVVLKNLTFAGQDPGDFRLTIANSGGCQLDGKIAPSASCDVAVAFTPTAVGSRAATLSIETSAGKTAASLYGTGVESADVSVSMTGALQGKSIVYSITVKNAGPNAAANVFVNDALPTGTTLAGITYPTDVMTCDAPAVGQSGTVKCLIASLASGASTSLQLSVKAPATSKGTVTNTATATSMSLDPVSGNNTATVTTSLGRK
jgi:uncharacterized repeat protein (TIGR01451 family)